MNRYIFLFLLTTVAFSCGEDNPEDTNNTQFLNYDGPNSTSPILDPGTNAVAARFPLSEINAISNNRALGGVWLYIYNTPRSADLRIFKGGTSSSPGNNLVATFDITNNLAANVWNEILFEESIVLDDQLWIEFSFIQENRSQIIGCDAGPANPNGDWISLSSANFGAYRNFRDFANESINWNIRGVLVDQ